MNIMMCLYHDEITSVDLGRKSKDIQCDVCAIALQNDIEISTQHGRFRYYTFTATPDKLYRFLIDLSSKHEIILI